MSNILIWGNNNSKICIAKFMISFLDILPRIEYVGFWDTGVDRRRTRLTYTLPPDNALPGWITPNNQNWFSFFRSARLFEPRILPLTVAVFPVKLSRLHLFGMFGVLLNQLLVETPYPKCVVRFAYILSRRINSPCATSHALRT